jgi:hypothetical protein
MQIPSHQISNLGPREVRPFKFEPSQTEEILGGLERFGIALDARDLQKMFEAYRAGIPMLSGGMDAALLDPLTTPSLATPVQFLQEWLPGFVFIITQARKIDELIGITTQGRWEDEQIVQGILEHLGNTAIYGDQTNVPLSSWNTNFETRTVVRSEEGMQVGRLEEARAARMRVSSSDAKRIAAAEALEIVRNSIGFNGFDGGANRTFGFLNDPSLAAYITNPGPVWAGATFLEITGDIRAMFAALRVQSGDRIDPGKEAVTFALPVSLYDFLSVTSTFGNSVMQWLNETYPNTRVVSAIQLDTATGGLTGMYLYAEGVQDESTDDRRTWVQIVPNKFYTLGVEQQAKKYIEDYSNATAGALLKRPYAVVRMTGMDA